ncbi:Lrp/AsnC ligand binding domain-containing protein [Hydromonas duriensis]|uniref:AsnC family transcriptional regulator n=1 Tax=Hydromonas duriensis TaxID=1527608 RepID=A0A4R6YC22_9BURK|nr:Lrp/AsnC ligand binding domain-containing protein [Hydromonas duriensis]TDR33164.1 AsnC family transcriptional regulator [Hydromonas duriensis]
MRVEKKTSKTLDKIDRRILGILQEDGRIVMTDLAEKVGLSLTPCIERVRRMEREGIIMGYHARLNPKELGASLLVFVEISLKDMANGKFEEFRRAVLEVEQVQECHLVSGDFDYLVKARIREMSEYRQLLDVLLRLPGVVNSKSYVVMEEIKETLALSLNHTAGSSMMQP